jgi:putative transposase
MKPPPDPDYRHRFPAEIIRHAVWLYHVFSLSLRDVELLLAERGVVVSYETIRRWCEKFGRSFANRLRRRRPRPGDKSRMKATRAGQPATINAHRPGGGSGLVKPVFRSPARIPAWVFSWGGPCAAPLSEKR